MTQISWSQLFKNRQATKNLFGDIWDLPIERRYFNVIKKYGQPKMRVLEIGAGGRGLKERLEKTWPETDYKSFDIDQNNYHDFYHLDDISGEYDVIYMFEIIEHVSPEIALNILQRAYSVLAPGGLIMMTTPNIFCPPNFLRDATHITPWCYDELGGVTQLAGFEVKAIYRLYHDALFKKIARRFLFYPIHRSLRIDFAKQIILVGQKPE